MGSNYPELYYRVYPKVIDAVSGYLNKGEFTGNVTEEDMEKNGG